MGETKKDQITFRLEAEAWEATVRGAKIEDIKIADFARKLHRLALILYDTAGSLSELRALVESIPASPGKTRKRGRTNGEGD